MNASSLANTEKENATVSKRDSQWAVPDHGLGDPRILIIDDTRSIHEDFRKILAPVEKPTLDDVEEELFERPATQCPRGRFVLDSAYQGSEGLALVQDALAKGHRYALAFVDVRMPPGWDGIETAAKLWAADPELQIVLCTAYSDYSWEEMIRSLGQTDSLLILKKPFDAAEVMQIAHALTRKWYLVQQAKWRLQDLDRTIGQRTQALQAAHDKLLQEIAERKGAEQRIAAFSTLGQRLSAAHTAREAAQIIGDIADQLLGWDACACELYSAAEKIVVHVLNLDIINGKRTECASAGNQALSPLAQRAIEQGGQLILRSQSDAAPRDTLPFGDTTRPSASILYVPIRNDQNVIGVLSIQSYTPNAYDRRSLETLQALADHCGSALDRIRMQEALRVSEEHFRSVWERSIDGMRLTDREGRIIAVNEAFCRLVKLPREKLVGQIFSVVYKGHGPNDGIDVYYHRFNTGTIVPRMSARVQFWNGEELELEISLSFIELGQKEKMVLAIFRDVTEQKRLEHQLRQSQKMEAVGQLAGGVAHDFNNLLAIIRGNTELVLMDESQLPKPAADCLKQVVGAADRAAKLTRQLLAFSRKQVMRSEPLNLNDVIGNFTKMLKRIIGEDIELQCNYAARLPFIQADVGMLEQVLVNLVINARDAMPKGGQLLLGTESATFDTAYAKSNPEGRAGKFVCLSVRDTGTGIAREHLPHIFEPFFTTKAVGKGTGLGLATVYGIIKQHQGWVDVDSQPGAGTTFRIFLPAIAPPPRAPAPSPSEAPPARGTETLLLVEDDEAVRALTRQVLENFGYRVREAASGAKALELWGSQGKEIDLLLTDMVMPDGVSGRELADQLLAQRPDLKVIFMSGYSDEVAGKDTTFLRQTGSRYLQKPCHWRDLLQAIRQSLDEG